MKKCLIAVTVSAIALTIFSGPLLAADSFLSTSGNIFTPDDTVLSVGSFDVNVHNVQFNNNAISMTVFGVELGATPGLEIDLAQMANSSGGSNSNTIINAKYQVIEEGTTSPSLTFGVVDATASLNANGNPGFYAVVGKNLTKHTNDFSDKPIPESHVYVGIGTGIYNGFFAGANFGLTDHVQLMAEYVNEVKIQNVFDMQSGFNAGVRLNLTDNIRADVAWLNGSNIGYGIAYVQKGL
jgi:hypothetical protein